MNSLKPTYGPDKDGFQKNRFKLGPPDRGLISFGGDRRGIERNGSMSNELISPRFLPIVSNNTELYSIDRASTILKLATIIETRRSKILDGANVKDVHHTFARTRKGVSR